MGRAQKLLKKIKKNEDHIRRNYSKLAKLEAHEEVTDIVKKEKVDTSVFNPEMEKHIDEFLEENSELMDKLAESERQEETLQEPLEPEQEIEEEEVEGFSTRAINIQRVDYSYPNEKDYGLELQVPVGIITASGVKPGDEVVVCSGVLESRSLEVIEVMNATTMRLDDVPTYSGQESNISIKFIFN